MKSSSIPFPKHGIRLSHLPNILEIFGGREGLIGLTTTEVSEKIVKPLTAESKLSVCEYLEKINHNAYAPESTVFLSHAWKYQFLDVVDAIIEHFQDRSNREQIREDEIIIWFDIFSNNQHQAVLLDFTWWSTTFFSAIEQFHYTVVVLAPWQNPIPFTRVWCLFELFCTVKTKSKLEIALTKQEKGIFLQQMIQYPTKYAEEMLATIDCRNSDCFIPEDKVRIFAAIQETVGFEALNGLVIQRLQAWNLEFLQCAYDEQMTRKKLDETDKDKQKAAEVLALSYLHAMADLKHFYGHYEEATSLYEDCLQRRKSVLGESTFETLITMCNLAQHYDQDPSNSKITHTKAVEMHSYCLQAFTRLYGAKNIYVLTSQLHLAIAKMNRTHMPKDSTKDEKEVETMLIDCLANCNSSLDQHNMLILQCCVTLGAFYSEKYDIAQKTSLHVGAKTLEDDKYMESYNYFQKAKSYYNRGIETVDLSEQGKAYPLHLTALYGYATLVLKYCRTNKHKVNIELELELAIKRAEECYNQRSRMFGSEHFLTKVAKELVEECERLNSETVDLMGSDKDCSDDYISDKKTGINNMRRQLHYQTSELYNGRIHRDDSDSYIMRRQLHYQTSAHSFHRNSEITDDMELQKNGTQSSSQDAACCVCS